MKKFLICLLAVSSSLCASLAIAAPSLPAPSLAGSWRITFFLEPARTTGATQCIDFKLVPGTVSGVATSGTWTSPTFPGWTGQWIQLGDHVRFFGVTPALATEASGNVENNANFGGVSFNHFLKTNALTSSAGSFQGVRVRSCVGVVDNGGYRGDDPSGIPMLNDNNNNMN